MHTKRAVLGLVAILAWGVPGILWNCRGAAWSFHEPLTPPRPVQVMAHRGASRQAPENTKAALQRCLEDGFEWAEIDVRRLRDGRHVVWHDATLERLGRPEAKVADLGIEEWQALDAGSWFAPRFKEERPLTLADALALARGRLNLYLDCKEADPVGLAKEVIGAGVERQVVIYSQPDQLRAVRAAVGDKVAVMAKWRAPGGAASDPNSWMAELKPAAVEVDADEITPERVVALHQQGVRVEAKTLEAQDRPEVWRRVAEAGVDWIQTDLPEEVLVALFQQRQTARPCRVSFHRGAGHYAPENTLEAFAKAARLAADLVEFDVRKTADGGYFLLHDGRLDRTTSGKGPIADASTAVVEALDAGRWFGRPFQGLRLPTLDTFLAAVPASVELYFDAKAIEPEVLVGAIRRHGLADRTIVYQSASYLQKLRALEPRIRALPPLQKVEEIEELARTLHPYAVDAEWELLSRDVIERCHAHGIRVFSDALGPNETLERYRQAMDWGIDVIQTDHPLRVYRAMELRAAGR